MSAWRSLIGSKRYSGLRSERGSHLSRWPERTSSPLHETRKLVCQCVGSSAGPPSNLRRPERLFADEVLAR
jgi:hypothetical protein